MLVDTGVQKTTKRIKDLTTGVCFKYGNMFYLRIGLQAYTAMTFDGIAVQLETNTEVTVYSKAKVVVGEPDA